MISLQVLTKKKQENQKGISRFRPLLPNPWPQKVNANLNLTCKNILSKTKETMKYFQLLQAESNFASSRKQPHVPLDYNLQSPVDVQISNHIFKQKRDYKTNGEIQKCKTKGRLRLIHRYSSIFRHIQTYPNIIRHIQELFRHILIPV